MKHTLLVATLIGIVALALQGCDGPTPVYGSGRLSEESRQVSDFDEVLLSGPGTLHIEVGRKEALRIEAEDNLLRHLETEVDGDRLRIGVRRSVWLRNTRPIHFYLTVKTLEAISLSGSGKVVAPNLKAGTFAVSVTGSGEVEIDDLQASNVHLRISGSGNLFLDNLEAVSLNVNLSGSGDLNIAGGKVGEQTIAISGSSDYRATALASTSASTRISGSGTAAIRVQERLGAHITGSGSERYLGRPVVESTVSGSGDVKPLGG